MRAAGTGRTVGGGRGPLESAGENFGPHEIGKERRGGTRGQDLFTESACFSPCASETGRPAGAHQEVLANTFLTHEKQRPDRGIAFLGRFETCGER